MTLVLDNYDSFTYNLVQLLEMLGEKCRVVRNDKISTEGIRKLGPSRLVLSPGPGRPDSAGVTLEAIDGFAKKLPILGVCLGHQALGQYFGGRLIHAPRRMHGKTSTIRHSGEGLFHQVANPFSATRYHSLMVDADEFPETLQVTARSEDGVVMGLQHKTLPIYGVQFHPESCLTVAGPQLMRNFLRGDL